jgi:hypothetical protein
LKDSFLLRYKSVTSDLISIMSDQDCQGFISFLEKRNKRKDTKNVRLFKNLIAQQPKDLKRDYGVNAYNVLKKRLTDNLVSFIAESTFESETSVENAVIRLLVLSRKLFAHDKTKSGFVFLNKAEMAADRINHYSLLNEIYQTALQYGHVLSDEEHKRLINRSEANRDELNQQAKLAMAIAEVQRAYLKVERGGKPINLSDLLTDVYERFNISDERGYNFMSLFQLAQLADFSGASSKQYHAIDLFFLDKIEELTDGPLDTEKHLIYHIDLLYLVANIFFRQHQFEDSLNYLEKMHLQMQRANGRFVKERWVQYVTLRSLCHNYTGRWKKALSAVDELINSDDYHEDELLNPMLLKFTIHLQQQQFMEAKFIAAELGRTDSWYEKRMGTEWLLNKNFAEIILHSELNSVDYLESRLKALKRRLKMEHLKQMDHRIYTFLTLVEYAYKRPDSFDSDDFKKKVANAIEWKPKAEEDVFMMSFYAWLKAKLNKKDVYTTTLELFSE